MSYHGEVTELRFEEGTSSKFYRVYVLGDEEAGDVRVLMQWGRIGSHGQSKVELMTCSYGAAASWANERLDKKVDKGYQLHHARMLDTVAPEVLQLAAVNERSQQQAQAVVDKNMVAGMMAKLDSAVRLATGTTEDQARAVEVARDVRTSLEDLRAQVLQVESTVEVLDALIVNQLA